MEAAAEAETSIFESPSDGFFSHVDVVGREFVGDDAKIGKIGAAADANVGNIDLSQFLRQDFRRDLVSVLQARPTQPDFEAYRECGWAWIYNRVVFRTRISGDPTGERIVNRGPLFRSPVCCRLFDVPISILRQGAKNAAKGEEKNATL